MKQLCIAVYKEPGRDAFIISTFNHLMDLTRDRSFADSRHIGLDAEVARAGRALIGTEEELKEHIRDMMGHGFVMQYMYFIPLFRVPEHGEYASFESWYESFNPQGLSITDITRAAFLAGRNS